MKKAATVMVFLGVLGMSNLEAVTYQIANTVAGTSGYAYSGTVTTDDSFGNFTNVSAIIAWSITLNTPGGGDGVTTHVLDNLNSSVCLLYTSPSPRD